MVPVCILIQKAPSEKMSTLKKEESVPFSEGKITVVTSLEKVCNYTCMNPGPVEPRHALPLQTVKIQISWLLHRSCLP